MSRSGTSHSLRPRAMIVGPAPISATFGQRFPDTDGPDELKAIAATAIADGSGNQYPPAHGLPDLRLAVAEHQQRFYDLTVDPATDVVVTTGASEALAAAVIGLVSPGDEVIVFEPYFDLYPAIVAMAGATPVYVPLHTPEPGSGHEFSLDINALRQAITARTRMILVNSPHNPTGLVFSHLELREVADLAIVNDLIVLSYGFLHNYQSGQFLTEGVTRTRHVPTIPA